MSGIIERFQGYAGRNNLIDAMLQQQIVSGNRELAEELADRAEIIEVPEGEAITERSNCTRIRNTTIRVTITMYWMSLL